MLVLKKIIQKKINATGNLDRNELINFFKKQYYTPLIQKLIDDNGQEYSKRFTAEELADECLKIVADANDDIPQESGDPFLIPRSENQFKNQPYVNDNKKQKIRFIS